MSATHHAVTHRRIGPIGRMMRERSIAKSHRPVKPQEKISSIRILRGIACLLIVLWHLDGQLAQPNYFGEAIFTSHLTVGGLSGLFFVLSGFILLSVHWTEIGNPARVPAYLYRRLVRIYPLYWIVFAIAYGARYLHGADQTPTDPILVLKAAALVPLDPNVVGGTGAPVLFVAWTLQYFVLLYLLFGVLIASRIAATFVVLSLTAIWLLELKFGMHTPLSFLSPTPFLQFAGGMLVALAARQRWGEQFAWPALIAGFFTYVAMVALLKHAPAPLAQAWPADQLKPLAIGLIGSLLIFGMVTLERRGWRPQWRAGLRLGDISYPLYLIHVPVTAVIATVLVSLGLKGTLGASIAWVAALGGALVLAAVIHRTVEMPLVDASRRLILSFGSRRTRHSLDGTPPTRPTLATSGRAA